MKKDIQVLLTIIITLSIMFATSLLLDLPLIQKQTVRQIIIYIAIIAELLIGFAIFKQSLKG
ncbi:hypothetical protein [Mesoflavibacter profundi]|uniref:hypothetical protein n=1 Tax=Mesoflavibacter profundi TaxID=2708110 RepID=UPI0035154D69